MKNRLLAIVAVVVVVAAGGAYFLLGDSGEWNPGYTNYIEDAAGRKVYYPDEVERVAAIGSSALRLYCYAGDVDLIAGIESQESEWGDFWGRPYMLANEEKFLNLDTNIGLGGPSETPEKETLISADLDVIFITYPLTDKELDNLQNSVRTSVIKLDHGNNPPFDEAIYKSLSIVGKVCGTEDRAEASINLIKDIQEEFNDLTKDIPEDERIRAYIGGLSKRGQQSLSSTTSAYSLFDALNIINVYESETSDEIHSIDEEALLDFDIEFVFLDEGGIDNIISDYKKDSTLVDQLEVFTDDNVFVIARSNWYANNIEVILLNGYYIASVLYPEYFDIDLEEKFNEITNVLLGAEIYEEFMNGNYPDGPKRVCFVSWSEIDKD